jgi:hypothetical protein
VNEPIYARDGWRCAYQVPGVCRGRAESVDHRIHGDHSDQRPSNRISACGDGTTGCHGWKEAHPAAAGAKGWTVSRHGDRDTSQVPAHLDHPVYGPGWFRLGDDGGIDRLLPSASGTCLLDGEGREYAWPRWEGQ